MRKFTLAPPFILGIETSTPIGSVAVFANGKLVSVINHHYERTHAKLMAPMIEWVLKHAGLRPDQIDAVAVSKGPGSYTGLRVGVSSAKGLCLALDKPLIGISSLEVLAWKVQPLAEQLGAWICPMIDARRMEVYCTFFDHEMHEKAIHQAKIIEEGAFKEILSKRPVIFLGSGAAKCKEILGEHPNAILLTQELATAAYMGKAATIRFHNRDWDNLITFEPYYLKNVAATKPKNPLLK